MFSILTSFSLVATALIPSVYAVASPVQSPVGDLEPRPDANATSACKAYGIDYQSGGSYFIDQNSRLPFTAVTKFEGCNPGNKFEPGHAEILLVNLDTKKQYECSKVATTPDDTPQLSTCKILKSEMVSGKWSLLTIGNNGDSKSFAYERDFVLDVAAQQTTTVTKTCVYTYTEKPTTTITSTSTVATTNTIPNTSILTSPADTAIITVTPKPSSANATSTISRTFTTWTRSESISTAVVEPKCTVPPRPQLPDPKCSIVPTIIPAPARPQIGAHGQSQQINRRQAEQAPSAAPPMIMPMAGGADVATITVTAPYAVNSTTTFTAPAKTIEAIFTTTNTIMTTAAPKTVWMGTAMSTTYAPAKTETQWGRAYTRVYEMQTMCVEWTYTTTTTPQALQTSCRAQGGHFYQG